MAAVAAVFDIRLDARELRDELAQLNRRGKNLDGVMRAIAHDMVDRVEDNFETEGHGEWKGLAESTLRQRRRQGRGAKILQNTGDLAGSITADWGADFAEAYTNKEYAIYHVSKRPRRKIPLRDFLAIDMREVERDAVDMLTEEIVG